MPARLDQAPIHAAIDLQAAEGVGHLDRTPEALRQLRRETRHARRAAREDDAAERLVGGGGPEEAERDRKSTRLNSSHLVISYAVFCLKKKKKKITHRYISHTYMPR